jgi:hypothetical protein
MVFMKGLEFPEVILVDFFCDFPCNSFGMIYYWGEMYLMLLVDQRLKVN